MGTNEADSNTTDLGEASSDPTAAEIGSVQSEPATAHQGLGEWHGKDLIDRDGAKIGKLEDVYFDIETDEPQFGTVKEGLIDRHLTFVPLIGVTIGPDNLQVIVTKQQVRDAPNIEREGDELSQVDESTLYHYYQLNYTPTDNPSGRRLARR